VAIIRRFDGGALLGNRSALLCASLGAISTSRGGGLSASETNRYSTDGANLGARLLLVLSRGGAADISLTQSWVAPGTDDESNDALLGYAFTRNLRLSTDIQKQNARQSKDSRVGMRWVDALKSQKY